MESRIREKFFFDNKTEKIITIFFAGLLLIQFGLWVYFNLFRQFVVDNDAAKLFYHTIKIWENKTFVIKDWMYPTTGEWDCSSILAALFYGLTGNIYISFGIANVINIVLMIVIVYQLLKQLKVRLPIIVFTLNVILIPYAWGMLEYSNMLFYGGAQYIYKVMIPLALCLVYVLSDSAEKCGWKFWTFLSIMLGFMFATASSSGLFCFVCGILPVLLCRVVRFIACPVSRKRRNLCITGGVIIVYFAGIVFQHLSEIPLYAENILLASGATFSTNITGCIRVFSQLVLAFPYGTNVSAVSLEGIGYLLRLALLIVIIFAGVQNRKKVLGMNLFLKQDSNGNQLMMEAYFISIFVVSYILIMLLGIGDSVYHRYYLIGFIPLVLIFGIWINSLNKNRWSILFRRLIMSLVVFIMLFQWCDAFQKSYRMIRRGINKSLI